MLPVKLAPCDSFVQGLRIDETMVRVDGSESSSRPCQYRLKIGMEMGNKGFSLVELWSRRVARVAPPARRERGIPRGVPAVQLKGVYMSLRNSLSRSGWPPSEDSLVPSPALQSAPAPAPIPVQVCGCALCNGSGPLPCGRGFPKKLASRAGLTNLASQGVGPSPLCLPKFPRKSFFEKPTKP